MTIDSSILGDVVHNALVYLAQYPLQFDEDFEKRLPHLQAATTQWNSIPPAYQERIHIHWLTIGGLYTEANGVWLEEPGLEGKRADMTRRMKHEWQVLEFKISDISSLNQKSRRQVRDMMARLKEELPPTAVVKGYRVLLPIDLTVLPDPVWTEITSLPAS